MAELELDITDIRRVGFLLATAFRLTVLERSFFLGGEAKSSLSVETEVQLRVDFRFFLVCLSLISRLCLRVFMFSI